jgi:hypothetical protein
MKGVRNGFFILECMVYTVIFSLLLIQVFSMTQHIVTHSKRLFQTSSVLQELFFVHMAFLHEIHGAPIKSVDWFKHQKNECQWAVNNQITALSIDNGRLIKSFSSSEGNGQRYTVELCHSLQESFFEYTEDSERILLVSLHLMTMDGQKLTLVAAPEAGA